MAVLLGISPQSVKMWNRHELLRSHACNDKNDCLFEHPPAKLHREKREAGSCPNAGS
jgi:hypothetical protein